MLESILSQWHVLHSPNTPVRREGSLYNSVLETGKIKTSIIQTNDAETEMLRISINIYVLAFSSQTRLHATITIQLILLQKIWADLQTFFPTFLWFSPFQPIFCYGINLQTMCVVLQVTVCERYPVQ